ncbi:MAG TPA: PAS domain S-box protein, partial [Roseiflexaceae bacterium]|nr:PAS domain S-box protein [Roseiflexaceae bacterium]
PDDRAHVRQQLELALSSGTLPSTEFRMYALGYKLHWLAAHGYVERDDQGRPLRVIGIAMDIDERKRAEEELRRRETSFKTLVENAPDIISRFDRNLRHLYVSPMIEQVTGMPAEAFLGKSNRELGMPEHLCVEWEARLEDVFESGKSQVIEFEFTMQTGELRRYQSTLVPEFSVNGKNETVLSIARDITEFVRAEERLRFLAEAGTALASSLDAQAALELLARLMVPQLADACTIDLIDEQHTIRPAVVAHADANLEQAFYEMRRRYPPVWGSSHPVAQVLQAGSSLVVDHIPPRMIDENLYDEQHRRLVQQFAPRSFLMVPFRVRGQLAGVISLYALHVMRHYTDDDRTLVEELARRAATALDNARLYGEAQEAL